MFSVFGRPVLTKYSPRALYYAAGTDQRLGDGIRRRGRLLPGQQRHRVGRQRRERPPLHPPARPDHAAQRARHKESVGDTLRAGVDCCINAGRTQSTCTAGRIEYSVEYLIEYSSTRRGK